MRGNDCLRVNVRLGGDGGLVGHQHSTGNSRAKAKVASNWRFVSPQLRSQANSLLSHFFVERCRNSTLPVTELEAMIRQELMAQTALADGPVAPPAADAMPRRSLASERPQPMFGSKRGGQCHASNPAPPSAGKLTVLSLPVPPSPSPAATGRMCGLDTLVLASQHHATVDVPVPAQASHALHLQLYQQAIQQRLAVVRQQAASLTQFAQDMHAAVEEWATTEHARLEAWSVSCNEAMTSGTQGHLDTDAVALTQLAATHQLMAAPSVADLAPRWLAPALLAQIPKSPPPQSGVLVTKLLSGVPTAAVPLPSPAVPPPAALASVATVMVAGDDAVTTETAPSAPPSMQP